MFAIFISHVFTVLIFLSPAFADQFDKHEAGCSRAELSKFRTGEFLKLFKAAKYQQAAKAMQIYLKNNKCGEDLYHTSIDFKKQDKAEYLWAESDLILAQAKAGRYEDCIELGEYELNNFPSNLIEELGDKKIENAFRVNVKSCRKKRMEGYILLEQKNKVCPFNLVGSKIDSSTIIEVAGSVDTESDYSCVALVTLRDGDLKTHSLNEATKKNPSGSEGESTEETSSSAVLATRTKAGMVFDKFKTELQCSTLNWAKFYHDKAKSLVVEVSIGLAPCSGTAVGYYEGLFKLKSDKVEKISEIEIWLH